MKRVRILLYPLFVLGLLYIYTKTEKISALSEGPPFSQDIKKDKISK